MSYQYPEGRYRAVVIDQYFSETNSGKTQFCLTIEPQAARVGDDFEPIESPHARTIYRVLETDNPESEANMIDWLRSDLKHLGYTCSRVSDLDPNAPAERYHSFAGVEIEVRCRHDA